jgi:hypothetical protein
LLWGYHFSFEWSKHMMMKHKAVFSVLVGLALAAPSSLAASPIAGTVVAIQGDAYVVQFEQDLAVSVGSVLDVYRRLPDLRGSAKYRQSPNWWQMGSLKVVSTGEDYGIAVLESPPAEAPPAGLDESGIPVGLVRLGDKVRTTGAVAERPNQVRVSFARSDLFSSKDYELPDEGEKFLREWLRGLKSMDGPIEVQVHAHLPELGLALPDPDRTISALRDSPFGAAPGTPVTPAEGLYERPVEPVNVPSGREVLVVGEGGAKDTWHYMDPVTLAQRHGARIAGALASRLEVKPTVIRVTVVPRPLTLTNPKTPGYDYSGDQIRILATAINWSEPPPKKKIRKKKEKQPEKRKKRRRLLEQSPKEMSALNLADGNTRG